MNAKVTTALAELIEICRVKCGPHDEVILPNGRTNHEALVDAVAALEEVRPTAVSFKRGFEGYVEIIRRHLASGGIPPHAFTLNELQAAYAEGIEPDAAYDSFRDNYQRLHPELWRAAIDACRFTGQ